MKGQGKQEIPEKSHRHMALLGANPTHESGGDPSGNRTRFVLAGLLVSRHCEMGFLGVLRFLPSLHSFTVPPPTHLTPIVKRLNPEHAISMHAGTWEHTHRWKASSTIRKFSSMRGSYPEIAAPGLRILPFHTSIDRRQPMRSLHRAYIASWHRRNPTRSPRDATLLVSCICILFLRSTVRHTTDKGREMLPQLSLTTVHLNPRTDCCGPAVSEKVVNACWKGLKKCSLYREPAPAEFSAAARHATPTCPHAEGRPTPPPPPLPACLPACLPASLPPQTVLPRLSRHPSARRWKLTTNRSSPNILHQCAHTRTHTHQVVAARKSFSRNNLAFRLDSYQLETGTNEARRDEMASSKPTKREQIPRVGNTGWRRIRKSPKKTITPRLPAAHCPPPPRALPTSGPEIERGIPDMGGKQLFLGRDVKQNILNITDPGEAGATWEPAARGTDGDVTSRLSGYSSTTTENQVGFPTGSLRDFRTWESRRDDAAGWRAFSGISRFPCPCIPALLHTHHISPSLALKTSIRPDHPAPLSRGVGDPNRLSPRLRDFETQEKSASFLVYHCIAFRGPLERTKHRIQHAPSLKLQARHFDGVAVSPSAIHPCETIRGETNTKLRRVPYPRREQWFAVLTQLEQTAATRRCTGQGKNPKHIATTVCTRNTEALADLPSLQHCIRDDRAATKCVLTLATPCMGSDFQKCTRDSELQQSGCALQHYNHYVHRGEGLICDHLLGHAGYEPLTRLRDGGRRERSISKPRRQANYSTDVWPVTKQMGTKAGVALRPA
ncbi:hypothetical protein PR048_009694 [Dryococelus australis]|uniref:Uncharacterized protein n=1 Tax=Dryococelus australis TaxID=614101 RepID=A0ABQ9I0M7_9NEOP|nr:hypothetical protein PR048_009694 [Dryococelus australis]